MTLRDWFAGQALAGIMANEKRIREIIQLADRQDRQVPNSIAIDCYALADAMIAERAKRSD